MRPVGGNEWVSLDARVVAASNQDIRTAAKRGAFRQDLYFRLNVISFTLPPLRERKADIPDIVEAIIMQYSGKGRAVTGISQDALTQIMNCEWPGNVRELENCLLRAISLGEGPVIRVEDIALTPRDSGRVGPDPEETLSLSSLERTAILRSLELTEGNPAKAAKMLGIGKTTIYRKLKKIGCEYRRAPRKPA